MTMDSNKSGQQDLSSLLELEALLRKPDFVMEPKCWETILKYITAGGKPQHLIESLADSYVGYAQMASLVCKWLKLVDGPAGDAGQAGTSQDSAASQASPLDEFHFLKELTRLRFDPHQLSGIFSQGGGKPPTWLEGLTSEPRGRQLIYQLSASHKNCLLLNFAIQKILMQGHEDEVASVGSSLASYFSVFHRLLATRLKAVASMCATPPDPPSFQGGTAAEDPLETLSRELVQSCSQSQHTYLHAQQLLVLLGGHPTGGAIFRRLSQQLESAAAEGQAPVAVWTSIKMFIPPDASSSTAEAYNLVCRLLVAAPSLSPTDVVALATLYNDSSPPAVSVLQHPRLLESLLATVFLADNTKGEGMSKDTQTAAIDLLSHATSTSEVDARLPDSGIYAAGSPVGTRFNATREALSAALKLATRVEEGNISSDDTYAAYKVVASPVASIGLLQRMKSKLSLWEYYQHPSARSAAPTFIRLATAICLHQSALVPEVVDLFEATLGAVGNLRTEVSKLILGATVKLMRDCHTVEPCIAMVDRWARGADPSLLRYFIFQALAALHLPYSAFFARWLLKHMIASGVRRGRDGGGPNTALLQAYARSWENIQLDTKLETKECSFLEEVGGRQGG